MVQVLIKQFMDEHRLVTKCYEYLQKLAYEFEKKQSLELLLKLESFIHLTRRYIIEVHHLGEEKFLFPLIHQYVPLNHGGPRCGYFMSYKLMNDPTSRIFKIAEKQNINVQLPERYKEYQLSNTPLLIPIEEHWAGELVLKMALQEISNLKTDLKQSPRFLVSLLENYVELIHLHSQKEDECLFLITDQKLNSELQQKTLNDYLESLKQNNSSELIRIIENTLNS